MIYIIHCYLTMSIVAYILLSTIFFLTVCQTSQNSSYITPCLSFQSGNCVACLYNYHLYQSQCYLNITGCLAYTANTSGILLCTNCDSTISVSDGNGGCNLTVSPQELANMTYYGSISSQYGSPSFQVIPLSSALNSSNFQLVNQYMLKGEYNNFISRTSQPVQAVAFYSVNGINNYKILYSGSGGGLMMCIISLNTVYFSIRIISFVQIGLSNIVNNCQLYGTSLQCMQCGTGYHIENGQCYANIDNCVSYSQNLCLQCEGFALLVENRCLSDCSLGDLSQILFYGDFRLLMAEAVIQVSRSYLFS